MDKENGRLKPKEGYEANSSRDGKTFVCKGCGHTQTIYGVEFGKKYICIFCDGILTEQ